MYPPRRGSGFGNRNRNVESGAKPRAKPLKRPSQARAKFTVQAIYDAFVRIWKAHGWAGVTTRAVALETGIAVGTLYDYFPNKQALLSGYVRHSLDVLISRLDSEVIQPQSLDWQERVRRLVRMTGGGMLGESLHIDRDMLLLEFKIAEAKHHRRAFDELSAKWHEAFAACKDLPQVPAAPTIDTLFTAVLGGCRYVLMVGPAQLDMEVWVEQMESVCLAAVAKHQPN